MYISQVAKYIFEQVKDVEIGPMTVCKDPLTECKNPMTGDGPNLPAATAQVEYYPKTSVIVFDKAKVSAVLGKVV